MKIFNSRPLTDKSYSLIPVKSESEAIDILVDAYFREDKFIQNPSFDEKGLVYEVPDVNLFGKEITRVKHNKFISYVADTLMGQPAIKIQTYYDNFQKKPVTDVFR